MKEEQLSKNLKDNEAIINRIFSNCSDLQIRKLNLFNAVPGLLVYFQEMVDSTQLDSALIQPLMQKQENVRKSSADFIEWMEKESLPVSQAVTATDLQEIVQRITLGQVILLVSSFKEAICLNMDNHQINRQVEEPSSEVLIRGPHIGFIENLNVNMALIRKRVRDPRLKMEKMIIGNSSRTDVVLAYVENMAQPDVIREVRERLSKIDVDLILESGNIEELINDVPYTPFPLMQMTERPDSVAALVQEGRVAILVDGTPMALIVPITFWYGFQIVEDYYINYIFASFTRWLRFFFAMLALLLPSIFIAITTFHQEMIPTSLALSIAASREAVPFPTLVETFMMEVTFEALREAGVRLPRPIGQTISIVGALVIGEAAVQAGIISAPIIIIVALTGIASFLIPHVNMNQAVRLMRFPIMLLAGTFGLYGMGIALIALLIHLVNLRSFGVPYLFPVAPFNAAGLLDVFVRAPWKLMHKRHHHKRELKPS